jgi:6-phosphofructokinase 1
MKATHIGVLTAGGDCPGLNACVRAVVRSALAAGVRVSGIRHGYRGILNSELTPLESRSVGGTIHLGGTILRTARFTELKQPEVVRRVAEQLDRLSLQGLIVIGGDGSQRAASEISVHARTPLVLVPKTIDNDVGGTDYAIGFDSAVNTAVEAVDKIRDTAVSHERVFAVEVMGRNRGFLAAAVGLASGAEIVCTPEAPLDANAVAAALQRAAAQGKLSSIVVVAEGCAGGAAGLAQSLRSKTSFDVRVTVLGHVQRGGPPTAFDRILASQLGQQAFAAMVAGGPRAQMVGRMRGQPVTHDLQAALQLVPHAFQEARELCHHLAGIWVPAHSSAG